MKKRNQNDAIVKTQNIKNEDHFLSLLNYVNKEDDSEKITTIREDDILLLLNRQRQKRHEQIQSKKGGRRPNFGKMFIVSFPPEYTPKIDKLTIQEKKELAKSYIKVLVKQVKKTYPDLDVQDLVNSINIDLHNDTGKRHFHVLMPNICKLKNGEIKRIDLGKKGYTVTLKTQHFKNMSDISPQICETLTREELNEKRKIAAAKNEKYANSYKTLLNKLEKSEVEEHIKWIKRLDKKLAQFSKALHGPKLKKLPIEEQYIFLDRFYKDIDKDIEKTKQEEVKKIYKEELKRINKDRRTQDW
jgi:hypothetical protein